MQILQVEDDLGEAKPNEFVDTVFAVVDIIKLLFKGFNSNLDVENKPISIERRKKTREKEF